MTRAASPSLVAVDVGNSRIKIGTFASLSAKGAPPHGKLPEPEHCFTLPADQWTEAQLIDVFGAGKADAAIDGAHWAIASVNQQAAERLVAWLDGQSAVCERFTHKNIPIRTSVAEPERTGVDRLLAGLATNHLRNAARPAITVDVGSAITVDLITADGAFAGGAILPGIEMAARALHDQTAQLPHHERRDLDTPSPPALGNSTDAAIDSGLFWGAIGGVRELISRLATEGPSQPEVFLTGGTAVAIAELLRTADAPPVRHVPHLVLSGIALTARSIQ